MAALPLNDTDDAEVKPAPVITTLEPVAPLAGEKLPMDVEVAPSTFARSTVATLDGSAVKKV